MALAVALSWVFLVRFVLVMLFLIHLLLHTSAPLLVGWTPALVAKMRFVVNQLFLYLFVSFSCALLLVCSLVVTLVVAA